MKKRRLLSVGLLVMSVLFVSVFSLNLVIAEDFTTLHAYYESLDDSCTSDSDCVIKNIENCCGYYPKCLNVDAELDLDAVKDLCEDINESCGSKFNIGYCRCQGETDSKKKCVGNVRNPVYQCGDKHCFEDELNESSDNYCPKDCSKTGLYDDEDEEEIEDEEEDDNEDDNNESEQNRERERNCPDVVNPRCPEGSGSVSQGNDSDGCARANKCMKTLSNGRNAEIKIMPETASDRAIQRLGELNFTVELKEVGKGNETKPVYEVEGKKQGRFLGIFKMRARVSADIDAQTGQVLKTRKPWYAFLVSGV